MAAPTALDSDNNGLAVKEGRFESLFQEDLYAKNEISRMFWQILSFYLYQGEKREKNIQKKDTIALSAVSFDDSCQKQKSCQGRDKNLDDNKNEDEDENEEEEEVFMVEEEIAYNATEKLAKTDDFLEPIRLNQLQRL